MAMSKKNELADAFDILLGSDKIESHSACESIKSTEERPHVINIGSGDYSVFSVDDSYELARKAISLGVVAKGDIPAFPAQQKNTESAQAWRNVITPKDIGSLSRIAGTSLVRHRKEDSLQECFFDRGTSCLIFTGGVNRSADLPIPISGEIKNYLLSNQDIYVDVDAKDKTIKWTTVANYNVIRDHNKNIAQNKRLTFEWRKIKEMVEASQHFKDCVEQNQKLDALPFGWQVVAETSKALYKTSSKEVQTKNHIVLTTNFSRNGRFLSKGSFLCSPKSICKHPNERKLENEVFLNGVLIQRIPKLVSCEDCMDALAQFLKD